MKATSPLFARLRFTTKDVGKGFYRGNRTGSLGAHTPKGGYLIDYRKVRNYNVPDLTDCKLTPYVTKVLPEKIQSERTYWWEDKHFHLYRWAPGPIPGVGRRQRAMSFLKEWRLNSPDEFDRIVEHQFANTFPDDLKKWKGKQKEQAPIFKWFHRAQGRSEMAMHLKTQAEEKEPELKELKAEREQAMYRPYRPK